MASNFCDKCGQPVPKNNSLVAFEICLDDFAAVGAKRDRHFLPIIVDGKVICEGSPSRAQYIKGQPRDTRGFEYRPESEEPFRLAFAEMIISAKE